MPAKRKDPSGSSTVTIELIAAREGEKARRSVDLLGRVYECFLTRFAIAA
jgi:hypothetical protein